MKNIIFDFLGSSNKDSWISYFLYGLSFISAGLIILFFPQILVALIASVLFLIGAITIAIAFQIKRSQNKYQSIKININD